MHTAVAEAIEKLEQVGVAPFDELDGTAVVKLPAGDVFGLVVLHGLGRFSVRGPIHRRGRDPPVLLEARLRVLREILGPDPAIHGVVGVGEVHDLLLEICERDVHVAQDLRRQSVLPSRRTGVEGLSFAPVHVRAVEPEAHQAEVMGGRDETDPLPEALDVSGVLAHHVAGALRLGEVLLLFRRRKLLLEAAAASRGRECPQAHIPIQWVSYGADHERSRDVLLAQRSAFFLVVQTRP
mmetsp:Transcript_19812/g.54653  ORF Transcript_19812/g.54653 Transcript_19812/m.54653 type:complete len:238 (-) Transcript_19812:429-1142(-)